MRKMGLALASYVLLASCGGGRSGGEAASVVPGGTTPTVSPTASPTPSPGVGGLSTGEVKPTNDATFIAASMDLTTIGGVSQTKGVITGGMTSDRVTTFDTPSFSARYDGLTGYNLTDTVNSSVFGPSQLILDSTTPNGNGVVLFTKIATAEDYLALYQQTTYTSSFKGAGYTAAKYGGTAGWQHTVVSGTSRRTRLDYFAYGSATLAGNMPRSGIVRFSMLGSGNYATDTDLWFLSSVIGNNITVDFGAGTISGKLGLAGENFYKNVVGGIGYIPLNANIVGNGASAAFSSASLGVYGNVQGQFRLQFIGPRADELVVTYVANDGKQAAVGSAIGLIDPYLN